VLFMVPGPLLLFTPQLAAAKRTGKREYGTLAERYIREFDAKWLRGGALAGEPLVGSGDIQSLANLNNGIKQRRPASGRTACRRRPRRSGEEKRAVFWYGNAAGGSSCGRKQPRQ